MAVPSLDLLRSGYQINDIQINNIQGLLGPSGQINIHVFMPVQWLDAIPLTFLFTFFFFFNQVKLFVDILYQSEVFLPK